MSAYELSYLWGETLMNIETFMTNAFAIICTYLLVAFFTAHRLTRAMVILVNALFIITLVTQAFIVFRLATVLGDINGQMKAMAAAGNGLEWHSVTQAPDMVNVIAPIGYAMVLLTGTFGALYFFFHSRRTNATRTKNIVDKMIDKVATDADEGEDDEPIKNPVTKSKP